MHVYVVLYDVYEVFHHYAFYKIDVCFKFFVRLHGEYNILVKLCGNTT